MSMDALLAIGASAGVLSIAVLRLSWSRAKRSVLLNIIGWVLLGGSLVAGWAAAGAWGASVASLWAMGAALAVLAWAAWRDPSPRSAGSNRRVGMVPEPGEPWQVSRRLATFAVVTFAAFATAVALGIVTRWAALLTGASEADANVLAFFSVPLIWAFLAFFVLMTHSRKRQLAIVVLPILAAIPALASGSML